MLVRVRRLIVGNSGSGKSTYAAESAVAHGLARLELDSIVWEPRKVAVERPAAEARADLDSFLRTHDRWVIEGCDGDLVAAALHACTELVFLSLDFAPPCPAHRIPRAFRPSRRPSCSK